MTATMTALAPEKQREPERAPSALEAAKELAALLSASAKAMSHPPGGSPPASTSSPELPGSPFGLSSPDVVRPSLGTVATLLGMLTPESPPQEGGLPLLRYGARKGRVCDLCNRSETPMWRRGPGGKGTLCNACGVRWSLRKKRPRPGEEGATADLPDPSTMLDNAGTAPSDDSSTDSTIAALRSRRDADRQDYYYCRYCEKTWPLNYFRNSQQFGAHCSNCSRKKRPATETEAAKPGRKRERNGREQKKAKRERRDASPTVRHQLKQEAGMESIAMDVGSTHAISTPSTTLSILATSSIQAPMSTTSPRGSERDTLREMALTKRRSRQGRRGSEDMSADSQQDDAEDEEEAAWERLFDKLKSSSKRHHNHHQLMAGAAARMSEEDKRREVELLEKEVTLLRYQVRLKEHWHKKSLKEVKHVMEEELHDLQKDLYYSFEVAQACIKLELESNEKEETQVLLAFACQVSPQPASPNHQQQSEDRPAGGAPAATVGSTPPDAADKSESACGPCHESLHKLRQEGERLRRSCHLQLARLKSDLEHHFTNKEEAFLRMLHDTKTNFSSSSQRLRKKINEIEALIRALRDSLDNDIVPTDEAEHSASPSLHAVCQ